MLRQRVCLATSRLMTLAVTLTPTTGTTITLNTTNSSNLNYDSNARSWSDDIPANTLATGTYNVLVSLENNSYNVSTSRSLLVDLR